MELNFIEVFTNIIIPSLTLFLAYVGWRANLEKKKLQTEIEGLRTANTSKDIENQDSWIDLYKKLHDDLAFRLTNAEEQISKLNKTIVKYEIAFKKGNTCPYCDTCPILLELSHHKGAHNRSTGTNRANSRQREPPRKKDGEADSDATGDGKTEH